MNSFEAALEQKRAAEREEDPPPTIACPGCGREICHSRDSEGNHWCGDHATCALEAAR